MVVNNKNYRTIWIKKQNPTVINVIDQNELPFRFIIKNLKNANDAITAIKDMTVRGAPLIGITAVYGLYLACNDYKKRYSDISSFKEYIENICSKLINTRPTAINLKSLLDKVVPELLKPDTIKDKTDLCLNLATKLSGEDIKINKKIGFFGYQILKSIKKRKKELNILTHCNAGWLATVDYGTAMSPIYTAAAKGMKIHVWIEETRPRNQGSRLTAWELKNMNIPHTVITDNAGGYVMQKGFVDVVIVGSDRTTVCGDVCNKIGTYKTALAAYDNNIPFYAAVPSYSFDYKIKNALIEIPIEERAESEVKYIEGLSGKRKLKIRIGNNESEYKNYGFDITPSRLITALITDKGVFRPNYKFIKKIKNPDYF